MWQRLGPVASRPSWKELVRASIGAGLGLALAGILVGLVEHFFPRTLFLFAPLGATAVLVFAVPSSPLAQPWNCVVGNTVPALYTLLLLWAFPMLSQTSLAALAVAGAIALMLLLRALHPPGGAVALLTVLAAAQMAPLGWHLLIPMAVLSGVLAAVGVLYHRACGRPYLHQPPQAAKTQRPTTRLALSEQDLELLLQRFDQSYNLTPEDLGELLAAAEEEAIRRRLSSVNCGTVMSSRLVTVGPQTPLEEVADLFHRHLVKSLPVVDAQGELIGRVLRADLFDWLWQDHRSRQQQNFWQRLRSRPPKVQSVAEELMRAPEMSVQEDTPMGDLLHELASHSVQFIAVLRGKTLVGVITRSDVIRTLLSMNP
ncbi:MULTISPECIES: HPP family protein [Comamonas]|jgi:CBS domain-containing membrane protein|nr:MULTISPECIES: HPP family protein [Comamonas]MDR3066520.1 HPP family protein [Comamonas sp.]MEB5966574.1 HPP family protein [Comamonas testosteroni]MPS92155.1 CBS domain-containing protein [Comamonas sp.]